jgi:hypothetical protein
MSRIERLSGSRGLLFPTIVWAVFALSLIFLHPGRAMAQGQWATSSDGRNISSANPGNVGIGTTNPADGKLQIVKDSAHNDGSTGALLLRNATAPNKGVYFGYDNSIDAGFFQAIQPGVAYKNFVINPNAGNVGIGTTTPTAKLDVNGDVNVTGSITAKYQDIAEWVSSSQALIAGTVVVLDPERTNHVLASSKTYDTSVAGVVTGQPGITLGVGGVGKLMIATTGRVRIKVDASRAPIRVGDLLVTSDITGVAMKSEPLEIGGTQIHRPGTLIGKALEPLAAGGGEILVLLSLQ